MLKCNYIFKFIMNYYMRSHYLFNALFFILCFACGLLESNAQSYKLITSTKDLEADATYLIASMKDGDGYVMNNYISGNNCKGTDATSNGGIINYKEGMAKLTLKSYSSSSWYFLDNQKRYMSMTEASGNYLKFEASSNYAIISISFTENSDATIAFKKQKASTYYVKFYDRSCLFSSYTSSYGPVYLYKYYDEKEVTDLIVSGNPTKTEYNLGDKPSSEGLTVEAEYSDGTTQDVTKDVEWSFDTEAIGESTTQIMATATYEGKSVSKTIDINVNIPGICTLDLTTNTSETQSSLQVVWNIGVGKMTLDKNGSGYSANYYIGTGGTSRVYEKHILTITPGTSIAKVVFSLEQHIDSRKHFIASKISNATLYYSAGYEMELVPENPRTPISIQFPGVCYLTGLKVYTTVAAEITSAGYATLCLPYAAKVPAESNLEVFAAKDNGVNVKLIARGDGYIAANEGVVLKGDAGKYTFEATGVEVSKIDGNEIVGVSEATELTAGQNIYLLSQNNTTKKVAFRLLDTTYTLDANKAYLKVPASQGSRVMIDVDDEIETGIEAVSGEEVNAKANVIYNLAGQRMSRTTKGINIVNGKLIMK